MRVEGNGCGQSGDEGEVRLAIRRAASEEWFDGALSASGSACPELVPMHLQRRDV